MVILLCVVAFLVWTHENRVQPSCHAKGRIEETREVLSPAHSGRSSAQFEQWGLYDEAPFRRRKFSAVS
jgi:hypothetical protein